MNASIRTGAPTTNTLTTLMLQKQWADAELLDVMCQLPWLGRVTIGAIIVKIVRHFHTVDCIFRAHLLGVPHGYTSANPSEPRSLAALRQQTLEVDAWYVEYARAWEGTRADETLEVEFTDGDRQGLTREQILWHVALHGAYHRGNVGLLLRLCGAGALPDRLTSYLRVTTSAT